MHHPVLTSNYSPFPPTPYLYSPCSLLFNHLVVVWLCHPMDCSTPGFRGLHCLLEFVQTHGHWVSDAIQPSHPLLSPSSALNLSQHQGLFQWVSSLHQVAKIWELQLQHQSFRWIFTNKEHNFDYLIPLVTLPQTRHSAFRRPNPKWVWHTVPLPSCTPWASYLTSGGCSSLISKVVETDLSPY